MIDPNCFYEGIGPSMREPDRTDRFHANILNALKSMTIDDVRRYFSKSYVIQSTPTYYLEFAFPIYPSQEDDREEEK